MCRAGNWDRLFQPKVIDQIQDVLWKPQDDTSYVFHLILLNMWYVHQQYSTKMWNELKDKWAIFLKRGRWLKWKSAPMFKVNYTTHSALKSSEITPVARNRTTSDLKYDCLHMSNIRACVTFASRRPSRHTLSTRSKSLSSCFVRNRNNEKYWLTFLSSISTQVLQSALISWEEEKRERTRVRLMVREHSAVSLRCPLK